MAAHLLARGPRSGDLILDRHDFQIRLAKTAEQGKQSRALIYRMYSERGYKSTPQLDPIQTQNSITLQACHGINVFGTLDVCFDSETGLAADALYSAELDRYRVAGARVAQVTRLAVDPQFGSKDLLGALFHLVYIFLRPLGKVSDLFIEVHPRHAAFYRRMLNFHLAGERKLCARVDAPAVLMRVELSDVSEQIALYGGGQREERTLYSFFCSRQEETVIIHRVLSLSRFSKI